MKYLWVLPAIFCGIIFFNFWPSSPIDPANTLWETPENKFTLEFAEDFKYNDGLLDPRDYQCFLGNITVVSGDRAENIYTAYHFDRNYSIYELKCIYDIGPVTRPESFFYQIVGRNRMNLLWPIDSSFAAPLYDLKYKGKIGD